MLENLLQETGVEISENDISACHRVPKSKGGPKAVIIRFVSRRKRLEVMRNKKKLKGKTGLDKTFINDDLTVLRARLVGYIKSIPSIEKTWTVDGKIFCVKKSTVGLPHDARPRPIVIESPDDLFKLDVDNIDFEKLGLSHIAFGNDGQ